MKFDIKKAKKESKAKRTKAIAKATVSKDKIEQDKAGTFIDVPKSQFDKDASKIEKVLDKNSEAKIDGMTKHEMEDKESQEEENIKQLNAKEKELKAADKNIQGAEEAIEKEKAKIDREIKEKIA